jgi:predicted nucleotidyltransferase
MTRSGSTRPSRPATIDLTPEALALVQEILAAQVPDAEVLAYGSRVTGTAIPTSDLDIAVRGAARLSLRSLRTLEEAFEESDLPIQVDVVDWHRLTDSFRAVVERACVVVQG